MLQNKSLQNRLARYCKDAYGESGGLKLENQIRIKVGNDQAIIGYDPILCAVIVALRGSDLDWKDWRSNFRVICKDTAVGRMHRGFFDSTMKIIDEIRDVLQWPEFIGRRVLFTGHSRGGAEAAVAALWFSYFDKLPLLGVVTFGSPRVFKAQAARLFNKSVKCTRVVNNGDRVATLPWAVLGFRHPETLVKLSGGWWSRLPLIGFVDHDVDQYIEATK